MEDKKDYNELINQYNNGYMMIPNGDYVVPDLSKLANIGQKLPIQGFNKRMVRLSDLRFKSKTMLRDDKILNLEEICQYGIPVIDYILFLDLKIKGYNINFELDAELGSINETLAIKCFSMAYYLLMTRAKLTYDVGEKLPKFLESFNDHEISYKEILSALSRNNFEGMDHSWIRNVDISSLGEEAKSRFKAGIAGCRDINIFKNYSVTRTLDQKTNELVLKLRDLALSGPYYEQHPILMPDDLKSQSISKNLCNLIIEVYDDKEIMSMVKDKAKPL